MNADTLRAIMPYAGKRANLYAQPLTEAMAEFDISTPRRQAAFLAQLAHESGELRYVRELASGEDYDIGEKAKRLGNTPEDDDDGERYKGRGLIQITGTANYRACSLAIFGDVSLLLKQPQLLEQPTIAARSAAWFWKSRGLNDLADIADFRGITRIINNGYNGFSDRLAHWRRAKDVLGA